jgi:hypothetical protein
VTNVGKYSYDAFHIADRLLIISASCCVFIKMHIANYLDIHSLKVRFKKGTHYHISLKFLYIYWSEYSSVWLLDFDLNCFVPF